MSGGVANGIDLYLCFFKFKNVFFFFFRWRICMFFFFFYFFLCPAISIVMSIEMLFTATIVRRNGCASMSLNFSLLPVCIGRVFWRAKCAYNDVALENQHWCALLRALLRVWHRMRLF